MHELTTTRKVSVTQLKLPALLTALLVSLVLGMGMFASVEQAYAAAPAGTPAFELSDTKVVFNKALAKDYYSSYSVYSKNSGVYLTKIKKNSKPNVASAYISGAKYVRIVPKKAGKTTITLVDQYNRTAKIKVTVKKNYFPTYIKNNSWASVAAGSKNMSITTANPNMSASVRIGGKTYKTTSDNVGRAAVTLNKPAKALAKYKVTFKDPISKAKAKTSFEVYNNSYLNAWYFDKTKKQIYTYVRNVQKGDKLVVQAGSYKKTVKIKKDYINEYVNITIKLKKPVENYSNIKVILKNSKGKEITSTSV